MNILKLEQNYTLCKPQLRWALAILSVALQFVGLFLDRIIPAGAPFSFSIMCAGFFFGFLLLFLSNTLKEAAASTLFFIGPLPILGIVSIGLTIFVSLFYNQNNLVDKIQSYITISLGLSMICFTLLWPYILGPLAVKAFKNMKKKNK
jgi:hypothetical protein